MQPNASAAQAQRLQAGVTVTGNLDNSSDVDYFSFSVDDFNPCSGFTFAYPSNGGFSVTVCRLVNGELQEIKERDFTTDKETVGNVIEHVTLSDLTAGTYYLKVCRRSYCNTSNDDYQLTVDR